MIPRPIPEVVNLKQLKNTLVTNTNTTTSEPFIARAIKYLEGSITVSSFKSLWISDELNRAFFTYAARPIYQRDIFLKDVAYSILNSPIESDIDDDNDYNIGKDGINVEDENNEVFNSLHDASHANDNLKHSKIVFKSTFMHEEVELKNGEKHLNVLPVEVIIHEEDDWQEKCMRDVISRFHITDRLKILFVCAVVGKMFLKLYFLVCVLLL